MICLMKYFLCYTLYFYMSGTSVPLPLGHTQKYVWLGFPYLPYLKPPYSKNFVLLGTSSTQSVLQMSPLPALSKGVKCVKCDRTFQFSILMV